MMNPTIFVKAVLARAIIAANTCAVVRCKRINSCTATEKYPLKAPRVESIETLRSIATEFTEKQQAVQVAAGRIKY